MNNLSEVRLDEQKEFQKEETNTLKIFNEEGGFNQNRVVGVALLIVLFGTFWIYGWAGQITFVAVSSQPSNWTSQSIYGPLMIMGALFTVVGYGLLFTFYKNSIAASLFMSIFVVSFTTIASPIIQKFWFNVFISDFVGQTFTSDAPERFLYWTYDGWSIPIDLYNMKVTFANCISQLVIFLGLFGKLSIPQIIFNSIFYNVLWNLNYFLCCFLQIKGPDTRIFDDYQISQVYLFASAYSLVLSLILKRPLIRKSNSNNQESSVIALLGTFFIWMSFCTTTTFFPLKFTPGQSQYERSYIWQEAYLSSFFALSGSVIFTFAFSVLFGSKVGLREAVFGTISGGVIYGSVAGTCINIGTAIACGLFAGLVSAFYFRFIYNRVNKTNTFDSYGVFNTLIISIFGTLGIAPIVLVAYYQRDWILTTLQVSNFDKVGLPLLNSSIAGWVLIYVGVSFGIGSASGLIIGFILRVIQNRFFKGFYNQAYFTLEYGLTQWNMEIFEQQLIFKTNCEQVIRVLRKYKGQRGASFEQTSILQMGRKANSLHSRFKIKKSSVDIDPQIKDEQFNKITEQLTTNKVVKKRDIIFSNPQRQNIHNSNHFKTIYYLFKSKKMEHKLNSSSLIELKATLVQRWSGVEEKYAKIEASFEKQDEGVAYLRALRQQYKQLQCNIEIQISKGKTKS